MRTIYVTSPLLAGALVLTSRPGVALDAQTARLERLTAILQAQGYRDTGRRWHGTVTAGPPAYRSVYLRKGVEYVVSAACDSVDADLALQVCSPAGVVAAEHLLRGDLPQVSYTPFTSGAHRIGVRARRCAPGAWGYSASVVRW